MLDTIKQVQYKEKKQGKRKTRMLIIRGAT
jgi:hypothetical protein